MSDGSKKAEPSLHASEKRRLKQLRESVLEFRLSPITKNFPSGTVNLSLLNC